MMCHASPVLWKHDRYHLAHRRPAARLAGLPADAGSAGGPAQPAAAEGLRPVPGRLRRPRPTDRPAGGAAAPLRAAAVPAVGAEPAVPPPRPDATARPGGPGR